MSRQQKRKQLHSNRFTALISEVDHEKFYEIGEAITLVKKTANAKFAEGIDLALRLGVDARKSDQNVRGITNLPHGTGKKQIVAVLAKGDLAKEAEAAGADFVGDDELITKIQGGWKAFDVMIAASDMAPQIGKVGRFLGPKTPNKRNGTVTDAVGQAVRDIKAATRVEYRIDKAGIVHLPLGKVTFTDEQILANFVAAVDAVVKAKPASSKGRYLNTVTMSSTMGPAVKLDPTLAGKAAGH